MTANRIYEHEIARDAFERWHAGSPFDKSPESQSWRAGYVSALMDIEAGCVPPFTFPRESSMSEAPLTTRMRDSGNLAWDADNRYDYLLWHEDADEIERLQAALSAAIAARDMPPRDP
jgi:hypothetical protein